MDDMTTNMLVKVDVDGTITYGNDDTEHLTRTPERLASLLQGIGELDSGKNVTVMINLD